MSEFQTRTINGNLNSLMISRSMLDPEDNSTILPLQSGWVGGGVGDFGGGGGVVGDGGGVGGANLLNLTSCLAG